MSAPLIDTHCHLDAQYFPEGAEEVLERGRAAGVVHVVAIGVGDTAEQAERVVALSCERDDVSATVGMHPHDAASLDDGIYERLAELAGNPQVVAIGEAGLDYHYMHSPKERQAEVFRKMIALAKQRGKPIIVHTREAAAETLAILAEEGASDVGGIIHCFSEDRAFARKALDLGFDISLSGIVTFKNATAVREVAAWAPAERLMVETDSPYLSPVPKRGKRNEPAYVLHTARCVAELRGEDFEEFAHCCTANALRRLGIERPDLSSSS